MKIEVSNQTISQIINLIPKDKMIKYFKEVLKIEERSYKQSSVLDYLIGDKKFLTIADFPLDGTSQAIIAGLIWDKECNETTIHIVDVLNIDDALIVSYKRTGDDSREYNSSVSIRDYLDGIKG